MKDKFLALIDLICTHKLISAAIALVLVLSIAVGTVVIINSNNDDEPKTSSVDSSEDVSSEEVSSEEVSSEEASSEESEVSSAPSKPVTSTPSQTITSGYKYNTNMNIENNIFMDSLVYTGYKLDYHRSLGKMWTYIPAASKRGMGILSNISYDYDGGTSGYETNANGKPDIAFFEKGDLVCASYVTYVYFNYLPNVAGIDTSSLTRPNKSYSANDWYIAAKDWIKKGYSSAIPFTASKSASGWINYKSAANIPIGSVVFFKNYGSNADYASHVAIYAGYKNGYNWLYHVGNDNGPEMCAIERMWYGPDPQWPLMVVSTPSNIRMAAALEVEVKDDKGNAIANVETSIGKTGANGKVLKEGLNYGSYTLTYTVPKGYYSDKNSVSIKLNPNNNSLNKVTLTFKKQQEVTSSKETESK